MIAMMKDKPVREMLEHLAQTADFVVTTSLEEHARSLEAEELARMLKEINPDLNVVPVQGEQDALHVFLNQLDDDDLGIVAGSLYLVSAVRPLLMNHGGRQGLT